MSTDLLPQLPGPVTVLDAGALPLGDAVYETLMRAGDCRVIGFEPVAEACARANEVHPALSCLPYCLGDGTRQTFYETNVSMTSSLYPPNTDFLKRFTYIEELTRTVATEEVQTARLDDLAELAETSVDFLKADVQGAEVQLFSGARRLLEEVVMIHTEACFVPLYQGQALFADIDAELRSQGFLFHSFQELKGRALCPIEPARGANTVLPTGGQLLWCDALYLPTYERIETLAPQKLLALAHLAHRCYALYDLCHLALTLHDAATGAERAPAYLDWLLTETGATLRDVE